LTIVVAISHQDFVALVESPGNFNSAPGDLFGSGKLRFSYGRLLDIRSNQLVLGMPYFVAVILPARTLDTERNKEKS
jgi:hypothetical protein